MLPPLSVCSLCFKITCLLTQLSAEPVQGAPDYSFSIIDMIRRMHWPAGIVVATLAIMSIYSISVILERWLTFKTARNQSLEFAPMASAALRKQEIDEALAITERHKKSHLALVVNAGLQEYLLQQTEAGPTEIEADAIRDALERAKAMKASEFSRGLSGLATIGSTAPFVGLLGTVLGIINAFQGLKVAESSSLSAVAGGISEALIETAFGLVVAIPAVWTFNYFRGKLDVFSIEMNNSSSELIRYLQRHRRRQGA